MPAEVVYRPLPWNKIPSMVGKMVLLYDRQTGEYRPYYIKKHNNTSLVCLSTGANDAGELWRACTNLYYLPEEGDDNIFELPNVWARLDLWCSIGSLEAGGKLIWSEWSRFTCHVNYKKRRIRVIGCTGQVTADAASHYPDQDYFFDEDKNEFWRFAACNIEAGDND